MARTGTYGRLEVSMSEPFGVHEDQPIQNLRDDLLCLALRDSRISLSDEERVQATQREVLEADRDG
jgi:hypothetical protein